MDAEIAQMLADVRAFPGLAGTPVTLEWTQWAGQPSVSAVTGQKSGTYVTETLVVQAICFYTIGPSTEGMRLYANLEQGNALIDFPAGAPLDGKDNLVFIVKGQRWVQKKVPDRISTAWDAIVLDQAVTRTVAVELEV